MLGFFGGALTDIKLKSCCTAFLYIVQMKQVDLVYITGSRHGLQLEIPQVFQRKLQRQDMKQIKRFGRKRAQAGHQATAVSMIQKMQENGMEVLL